MFLVGKKINIMRISFCLVYVYYRRLFSKGDSLTIISLILVFLYALYGLYHHYDSIYYLLWALPLGVLAYHNERKDLELLKIYPYYRFIIIAEYGIENFPFLLLILWKGDFITVIVLVILLMIIAFLPQRSWVLRYPFSLVDPFWHITFRQYKLLIGIPLAIALVIIGGIYENPNLALFALSITALIGCMPYFEREFTAHIVVASYRGKDYLIEQLKAGVFNSTLLFIPILIIYFICFQWQYIELLPLYIAIPTVGVLTKYAFLEQPLWQGVVLIIIIVSVLYIIPVIAIPYFYYLAIKNIKKIQYVRHSH